MGRGFTSGGQESGSAFGAVVCRMQARKCYIKSSPSVLKDKEAASLDGEMSAVQLPLDCTFALQK